MLLRCANSILSFSLFLFAAAAFGFPSDPQLLQLVPPESPLVAGMLSPSSPRQSRSALLVTRSNELDHEDFLAITGGDTSRSIREVLFIAAPGRGGILAEHSLLVGGHFDREAIFRLAHDGSITRQNYRGVQILAIPPFARERATFKELRWLAIPNDRIAIFGSVASVQRELDRWIAHSPADPELLERLSRLDRRDESWCLMPAPRQAGLVASILRKLDARLGDLAGVGQPIQFGIRMGKNVEITAATDPVTTQNERSDDQPRTESMAVSYFLSGSLGAGPPASELVRVTVRRQQYEKWLAYFSGAYAVSDRQPFR